MDKKFINDLFSLKGKKIVILGGAGKLGLNFAKTLKKAGAKVILGDVKKTNNNFSTFEYCNVSEETSIKNFFNKIIKKEKN